MPMVLAARCVMFLILIVGFAAPPRPVQAATVQVLQFQGTFAAAPRPGSDPIFAMLAGGTFFGTYAVPAGSLPGTPGTALALPDFRVSALSATGQTVFHFLSGRDFGALFFDFFGAGTGDGFVFNGGGVQFQIGLISGFTGTSPIVGDAIFGALGGPAGGIQIASGTAYVPSPAAGLFIVSGLGALLALGREKGRRARRLIG
jgi:hypothetical protein